MSDTRYSINKRIWIIKNKYLLHYPISIQPKWRKEFHTEPPTRPSIDLLFRKWETTGSVHDAARSGCPITIRTEEKKEQIRNHYEENPNTSLSRGSGQFDVSITSYFKRN